MNQSFVSLLQRYADTDVKVEMIDRIPKNVAAETLIHIVGTTSSTTLTAIKRCRQHGYLHIVSSMGYLCASKRNAVDSWNTYKTISVTQKAARGSMLIHLMGINEKEQIEKLSPHHPSVVIPNAIVTNRITPEEMTQQMCMVYQKLFYTYPSVTIHHDLSLFFFACLHDALDPYRGANYDLERIKTIGSILSLREKEYLMLLAQQEHVYDEFLIGAQRLEVDLPINSIQAVPRFDTPTSKVEPLPQDKPLSENILIGSAIDDYSSEDLEVELQLSITLLNYKYYLANGMAKLCHLLDIYQKLRYHNIDERIFLRMCKRLRIFQFVARLETIMASILFLPEGFMPIPPQDDKKTQLLKNQIIKLPYAYEERSI